MKVQDIYGAGKTRLVSEVVKALTIVLGKDGFLIDQVTINGALRLPQNVADANQPRDGATQNAIQAENRVRQVKAEAEQPSPKRTAAHRAASERRVRPTRIDRAAPTRAPTRSFAFRRPARCCNTAPSSGNGRLPMMQGGDKTPAVTFDVTHLTGSDADREKKLAELPAKTSAPPSPPKKPADKPADKRPNRQAPIVSDFFTGRPEGERGGASQSRRLRC